MDSLEGGGSSMNGSHASEATSNKESSSKLELEFSESDEDEDEEKKAERKMRRLAKEMKFLQTKLTKLKDEQEAAKRERANLKQVLKKNHILWREENKKFKKHDKKVQNVGSSMKEKEEEDDDEESDEDEEGEEEEEQEDELENEHEVESEEETESEESEEESGSETESESEAEEVSDDVKKAKLEERVKKHEYRLSALKKNNALLQAEVDNLQDVISKVRSKASSLHV